MKKETTGEFIYDQLFNERKEFVKFCFDVYREVYDLHDIRYEGDVSQELFNYCLNRDYFILLVIFDDDGRIYLERNIQEKLYWALPGGGISKKEDFHTASRRICRDRVNKNLEISQLEPVAHIINKFRYNNQSHLHYGMAFVARAVNASVIDLNNSVGAFVRVDDNELEKVNRYTNREVLRISRKKKLDNFVELFDDKFNNQIKNNRFDFYNHLVHKYLLAFSLKKKDDFFIKLKKYIGNAKNFLDVSCGDSDMVDRVGELKTNSYVVGNDIDWEKIRKYHKSGGKNLFTNHDAVSLPFKDKCFDVAYLGNTLHHVPDKKKLISLFDSILRVAKKIIIVEIEKPSETGLISLWLNRYLYEGWLYDRGNTYFGKKDFESLIKRKFGQYNLVFDEFSNIQGNYLIAVISTKKQSNNNRKSVVEVEEKYYCENGEFIREMANSLGFLLKESNYQDDIYFSDERGDYITNRTCLRIRNEGDKAELTYKGPSLKKNSSFAKDEYTVQIDIKDQDNLKEVLKQVGFFQFVRVEKYRETYSKLFEGYVANISLDKINEDTNFVEFELVAEEVKKTSELEEIMKFKLKKMVDIFEPAGLKNADLPYRDYVSDFIFTNKLKIVEVKNLLFDFDGTIVPTEKLFFMAYRRIVREVFDMNIELEDYIANELRKDNELFYRLSDQITDRISYEDFMTKVYTAYEKSLWELLDNDSVRRNFGLLRDLKRLNYRMGLVSTSKIKFIDRFFEAYQAYDLFEEVISRENVKMRKPHPEGYLKILELMKIDNRNSLAVEDSVRGIQSAKQAGLNCIGVVDNSLTDKDELEKLGIFVFDSMVQFGLLVKTQYRKNK